MTDLQKYRTGLDIAASWGKLEYSGWMDEGLSWKEDCYVGDWSYLDEIRVKGPDALKLFSDLAVNSFEKFAIGQGKHVICCNIDGKVIGEGILMRMADDEYEYNARGPVNTWIEYNYKKGGYDCSFELTMNQFKFQVSGPKSIFLLEKLTGESLRDIGFMRFRSAKVKGYELSFLRQGMAGEIGFEVHGPGEYAKEIMATIMSEGQEFGIRRMGARTAMVNHLEAGFPTVTHDYIPAITGPAEKDYFDQYNTVVTDHTSPEWYQSFERCLKVKGSFEGDDISAWFRSPVELGWSRNIKFDHEFYGRAALEAEMANPTRKIASLVWNSDDVKEVYDSLFEEGPTYDFMDMPRQQWFAMYTSKVMDGDKLIGSATSRGYSYYFRKVLSHAVIDVDYLEPGTEVTVIWGDPGSRQKVIRATVSHYPYKTDRRRTDLASLK